MLKSRSAQVGLFDAAMVMGPLPEGSFFALLAEHGDRIVRDEDFADCYSERMGRPSIPPSQLAKVLLLQHRTGVSDEQAMECVGWDLRWKVALGLAIDHQGWHPTSLTKFRARLLLHKKDGIALENTLRLARELGLLDGEPVTAAYELLRDLVGQDFDVDQDGVPRLHRGTRSGRIISTIDPEMQHGRKSSQSRFDGYKLSAAVTNSTVALITSVHVAPGGESDGPQAKHLIDQQPPEHRPDRILGDTAYGNGVVRSELAERNVDVLAPVPEGTVLEDRLGKRDFSIDPIAGTVSCPAGQTATITTSENGSRSVRFPRALCGDCPLKDRCCPGRANRQIALGEHEELMIAARQALNDPATAAHLRHTRPRIERLLGLMAHRYGARKSRYIGSDKARLQASWAAALVNLNPIGHHLATGIA